MTLALTGMVVAFFSLMGLWKPNGLFFMLAAGASTALGLQWFDVYTTNYGLTVSMMFIAYSWLCIAFAFKCLFWRGDIRPGDGS